MSQGTFSGLLTVFLFAAFIVGVLWAYSGKRKAEFEKGLRTIRDLLHDRGIDVPNNRERAGGNV